MVAWTRQKGLQEKESVLVPANERVVKQYGNAVLLNRSMSDILEQIRSAFPDDWQELYALSMVRVLGDVPLAQGAERMGQTVQHPRDQARPDAETLAEMLRRVGQDKKAQAKVFNGMCVAGDEVVYGMSAIFHPFRADGPHRPQSGRVGSACRR